MRFYLLGLALLVCLPGMAEAAGFAKESVFLSKTPVTEGEVVRIHATVANDAATTFTGEVVFKDAETTIGAVAVSIAPGGATTVSLSWQPSAGTHKVTAELTQGDGTVTEAEAATFYIDAKPEPAGAAENTSVESSDELQGKIASLSPAVAGVSAPLFATLDSARVKAAGALDSGITWAEQKTGGKKPGEILGTATEDTSSGGILGTLWLILGTTLYYMLSALRFLVGSAGIFYPVFALGFLYFLWRMFKRFRRPRY